MIDIVDRFIEYAKIYTTSDESSETCPSTARQKIWVIFWLSN